MDYPTHQMIIPRECPFARKEFSAFSLDNILAIRVVATLTSLRHNQASSDVESEELSLMKFFKQPVSLTDAVHGKVIYVLVLVILVQTIYPMTISASPIPLLIYQA